jgi:hypothetical protein
VGLTSPGAGKGGGGGEGGGGRLPLREGGEVADALAPLDGPVPDLQRKKSNFFLYFSMTFSDPVSQLLLLLLV